MSLRLALLKIWTPSALKRRGIERLFAAIAQAFPAELPPPEEDRIAQLARFCQHHAAQALVAGDTAVEQRLYDAGLDLGRHYRLYAGIRSYAQAIEFARLAYDAAGIELNSEGEQVIIRRCYFSGHFSSAVCRLMSTFDRGVLAGFTDRQVTFVERLSEGADCCRARLEGRRCRA